MRNHSNLVPATHPGVILKEEFLDPLGIKPAQLAKALGVTRARVSEICKGKRDITAETAILLGRFFDTTARFWINLQSHYDLELAKEERLREHHHELFLIMKQYKNGMHIVTKDSETGKTVNKSKYNPEKGLDVDKHLSTAC